MPNGKAELASEAAADENSDMCAAGGGDGIDDVGDIADDALDIELDLV